MKIEIYCCEGKYPRNCAGYQCSIYREAEGIADRRHRPYIGTGFGNLNGQTTEKEIMSIVPSIIAAGQKTEAEKAEDDTSGFMLCHSIFGWHSQGH